MAYDGTIKIDTKMDTSGFQSSANKLTDIVKGLGVFRLLEAGMQMVAASVDKAMGRIDTMEQFSRVMTTMTGSTEATNKALSATTDIVTGTAYGLDVAAKAVQNFVSRGMAVQDATTTVEAWGDAVAFYGDGSNAAFAGVTDALSKMQTKGNVTMEHMEMLLNAGIPAIEMYGDAMGMTSAEVTDAMSKGELKASDFIAALNKAMETGTAKFPSLSGAAKEAGASWSGTFDNMRAAVTRGVQSIITAIDDTNEIIGRPTIREGISAFGKAFESVLKAVAQVAGYVTKHLDDLALAAIGVGTAFAAHKVMTTWAAAAEKATKVSAALKEVGGQLTVSIGKMTQTSLQQAAASAKETAASAALTAQAAAATAAEKALNAEKAKAAVISGTSTEAINSQNAAEIARIASAKASRAATDAQTVSQTAQIAAEKAATAAQTEQNMSIGLGTALVGYLTGSVSLHAIATAASTAATKLFGMALKALPFAGIAALIGVVVAGIVKLVSWLAQGSEESRKQKAEIEALAKTQEEYSTSLTDSAKAHEENITSIRAEASASASLASEIDDLAEKENKSAEDKRRLAAYIQQLNEQQEGLNLTYDEENNHLSMNAEQVGKYIAAKQKIAETNALMERQNELYKEESAIKENIALLEEKQNELNQKLEEKTISQAEYNQRLQELNDTRQEYVDNEEEIATRMAIVNEQIGASDTASAQQLIDNSEAIAAAEETEMKRREEALGTYTDAATNMFDRISTNSKLSISDMIGNLEHNQQAVSDWADNLVILGDRGLDKGLLQQLRDAGPESAATVAALVKGSDTELSRLNDVFQSGSEVATDALLKQLGLPEVTNSGSDMVDDISEGVDNNTALVDATTKMIQDTKTAADTQVRDSNFSSVGTQIINGITQGVINGTSSLVNAMVSAVEQAASAAKKKAKINSPSKLFRDLIGLNIMKGWAQGITQGEGLVVEGVEGTVDALEGSALGTMLALPKAQMQGFVARMQAGVEARHAATAAQVTVPRIAAAAMGGVVELSDGSISALRGRGQDVGAINLTIKTLLDGEKVYESVQRVGLERGVQITSGRFDYVR